MIKFIICFVLLFNKTSYGDMALLLDQKGNNIDLQKKEAPLDYINLDNPFLIQFYASWKALQGPNLQWIRPLLLKDYEQSLALFSHSKNEKYTLLENAAELYLLYKTGFIQTFLNRWLSVASSSHFLQTELGIALDQIITPKSSKFLIDQGFYLSNENKNQLKTIESLPSFLNVSFQALNSLRSGEKALSAIGKITSDDPLRLPLAYTALLHFAREDKLGASGKIMKEIIQPALDKESNEEQISLYFITLARLLYQAQAITESQKYYDLIPESSSYFLKAKTESLWAYLREKNYSKAKGELGTLELTLFNDQFYPEAYVISAMTNVIMCQFNDAKLAINRFVEVNTRWAKEIEKNLHSKDAMPIVSDFFITNLKLAKLSLLKEKNLLENKKLDERYITELNHKIVAIDSSLQQEIYSQWANRKQILKDALYKMQFVKIELISRMRQVEMNMKIAGEDEVKQQNAAPKRKNNMEFPYQGPLWGDELFHIKAKVKNKCITLNQHRENK